MKKFLGSILVIFIAIAALNCAGLLFAQTPTPIGPTDAIGFDYPDAAFTAESISRFEAQYDGGAWSSINVPTKTGTVNGVSTYKVIPPQASGTHTVIFRPCSAAGCAPASSPFDFAVLTSPTTTITNVRKVAR